MNMVEAKRRRRPAVKRKIRCNKEKPCSNCLRSRTGECVYDEYPPGPKERPHRDAQVYGTGSDGDSQPPSQLTRLEQSMVSTNASMAAGDQSMSQAASFTNATTPLSHLGGYDVERLKDRVTQLEEELSRLTKEARKVALSTSTPSLRTTASQQAKSTPVYQETPFSEIAKENSLVDDTQSISRSTIHKTRLFGQSHWINVVGLFQDILEIVDPELQSMSSKLSMDLRRCKLLATTIKSERTPKWPTILSTELPPKEVTDELIDCYLRTIETTYRVLHIPTFMKEYQALWESQLTPSRPFLVQLKLVFAIGATIYDSDYTLRDSATKWVYEAYTWASEPEFKPRLNLQSLQISILLLLAREVTGIGEELTWISAGSLLRTAVYMGLHRDPGYMPNKPTLTAEMRRRLWNTTLEIALQTSMTSGAPPLLSVGDYDTEAPGNFNDDQLLEEDCIPEAEREFTQTAIAIALRKTFPIRLTIAKYLNDVGSHALYEKTLRLDAELRAAYKSLRQNIRAYNSRNCQSPSTFAIRAIDIVMNYYISALHIPFFGSGLSNAAYAFSRSAAVEGSLKIWYTAFPSSTFMAGSSYTTSSSLDRDDLTRLVICGSGFFRTLTFQASLITLMELRAKLQAEESVGPMPVRKDLHNVSDDALKWYLQCIHAGETNVKGYLIFYMVNSHVNGLLAGKGKEELTLSLLAATRECGEKCIPVLEDTLCRLRRRENGEFAVQAAADRPLDMAGWEFEMPDAFYHFGDIEPAAWLLDG